MLIKLASVVNIDSSTKSKVRQDNSVSDPHLILLVLRDGRQILVFMASSLTLRHSLQYTLNEGATFLFSAVMIRTTLNILG